MSQQTILLLRSQLYFCCHPLFVVVVLCEPDSCRKGINPRCMKIYVSHGSVHGRYQVMRTFDLWERFQSWTHIPGTPLHNSIKTQSFYPLHRCLFRGCIRSNQCVDTSTTSTYYSLLYLPFGGIHPWLISKGSIVQSFDPTSIRFRWQMNFHQKSSRTERT